LTPSRYGFIKRFLFRRSQSHESVIL
jgi:hypothetical protein